jgi:hypothetical protein
LVDALAKDATIDGPIFQSLKLRYSDAVSDISLASAGSLEQYTTLNSEFTSINTASKSHLFGKMLSDPINVLADMSEGKLPRIDALSVKAEEQIDGTSSTGAGQQLVGNPNYGSWRQNSSGNSFWAWYGQYAFFSSMMSRPYYYSSWSSNRGYSYYNDYGRSTYSSARVLKSQAALESQTRKKFSERGQRFNSPYAKKRATTSKISSQRITTSNSSYAKSKTTGSKSNNSFFKNSSKKSSYGSSRSSSYSSSRSSFGGK